MSQKKIITAWKDRQNNSLRLGSRRESLMERHEETKNTKWKNAKSKAGLNLHCLRLSAIVCYLRIAGNLLWKDTIKVIKEKILCDCLLKVAEKTKINGLLTYIVDIGQ